MHMCIFCLARDGKTQRSRLCADATGRCIRRCHEMGASCGCVRAHVHLCEECIAPICRYTDARTAGAFAKAPWDLINHLAATIPDARAYQHRICGDLFVPMHVCMSMSDIPTPM